MIGSKTAWERILAHHVGAMPRQNMIDGQTQCPKLGGPGAHGPGTGLKTRALDQQFHCARP